jgi:acetyltransferase EpsM
MKIVIIGQGGHSKVIRDIVKEHEEYELIGYLDDKFEKISFCDELYYGPISSAHEMIGWFDELKFVVAIGNNRIRKSVVESLNISDKDYATLIQKAAVVSPSTKIGHGTVVMANAVINSDAQIGNHAIINTGAIVEHDNQIGDFAHISPRATLTGTVFVGEGSHVGAGSTVIPNRKIGCWSLIGAGATVIQDVPSHCTAMGTPARVKVKTGSKG